MPQCTARHAFRPTKQGRRQSRRRRAPEPGIWAVSFEPPIQQMVNSPRVVQPPDHDFTIPQPPDRMAWPRRHVAHRARANRQPVGCRRASGRSESRALLSDATCSRFRPRHPCRSAGGLRLLRFDGQSHGDTGTAAIATPIYYGRRNSGYPHAVHPLYPSRRVPFR
jgi:hypothetical protein